MSKSGGEKRTTGGGDDLESSRVQQKIPTVMESEKESKTLRLLQGKYGEDFGRLVDEIYMSEFGLHKKVEVGKIHDYLGMILDLQIGGLVHITFQKMIESISIEMYRQLAIVQQNLIYLILSMRKYQNSFTEKSLNCYIW